MELRELKLKDAPFMLEWMHDESVVEYMQADFASKTIEDCQIFIEACKENRESVHMAIVDERDQYMGTVSLKHINQEYKDCEFAITIRKCAMGKGYSRIAMQKTLSLAFEKYGMEQVFWCVSNENTRAIKFYDKNGYQRVSIDKLRDIEDYSKDQKKEYIWYLVRKNN